MNAIALIWKAHGAFHDIKARLFDFYHWHYQADFYFDQGFETYFHLSLLAQKQRE